MPVLDRPEVPAGRHRVAAGREHGQAGGERDPEADRDPQQMQAQQDREPAGDDDRDGEREPRRHRPPPELERVGQLGAEQEEAEHEAEVRGVEDVPPAELDQVLGQQRHGGRPGEDPPAVHAPPVAVLRSGHAQDEGDAVPRQQRARGPQEHVLTPERDPDLEHRAREQRDENLGDREPELERHLPEHLQRDDHRGQVQPRIAQLRQQDRVGRTSNTQSRLADADRGGAHRALTLGAGLYLPQVGNSV